MNREFWVGLPNERRGLLVRINMTKWGPGCGGSWHKIWFRELTVRWLRREWNKELLPLAEISLEEEHVWGVPEAGWLRDVAGPYPPREITAPWSWGDLRAFLHSPSYGLAKLEWRSLAHSVFLELRWRSRDFQREKRRPSIEHCKTAAFGRRKKS